MRIVDICAYFVHKPISGGQARVFGFNQALSIYADIEQFSFTPVIMKNKTFAYSKNYKEHIHHNFLYTAGVVLLKIFGFRNYDFLIPYIFWFIKVPKELKKAINKADVIQVEHPWLLSWISKHTKKLVKPVVLVEHNVEYDLQKGFFSSIWKKCIINSIKRNEEKAVRKANLVFAMTEQDKKRLSKLYGVKENKIFVVPNGTRLKDYKSGLTKEQARKKLGLRKYKNIVLFVGSNHPPNKEAADFIKKKLAPKLKEVLFLIIGDVCKKKSKANVLCTGAHYNLLPHHRAADIAINPVVSGSGSNIKMYAYLANGLPVISTKKGLRGISARPGKDALTPDLKDFSNTIATLINDKKLQVILRSNSKKIAEKYDWGVIALKALKHYKKLL